MHVAFEREAETNNPEITSNPAVTSIEPATVENVTPAEAVTPAMTDENDKTNNETVAEPMTAEPIAQAM